MNLLVLGNGFDLLHGLPTTYKDFIDFITLFCMSLEKNDISHIDYDSRMVDFILHISPELSNELESLIKDNLWLIHLEKETINLNLVGLRTRPYMLLAAITVFEGYWPIENAMTTCHV